MHSVLARGICAVTLVAGGLVVASPGVASAVDISKPVSANAPAVTLAFANTGDNAALSFSGLKNQVVKVTTSAGTYASNCDVMVSVLKLTTTIAGPVCGGIAGTSGDINLPNDATYTIKVDTQGNAPASLKVALTSTGPIRSITPNAPAVTFSVPASSTTDFGFIVKAGQRLSGLTAAGSFTADCQVSLSIVAADGTTVLGTDTCAGKTGFVDALDSLGKGTYKLRVHNTAAPTGSLNLQVFQFKDKTAAITANGAAVATTVSVPGQRVFLTFSGTNGQKISFLTTAGTLTGYVELHKPDGSYEGTYTNATTGSFSDDVTLTATGTWSLLIDGTGTNKGSVTEKLYTFTDVTGGTIVANGAAQSLSTTRPGQNGSFGFSGTDGQKISFEVTASTIGGYVELHKPDGSYAGTYTNANVGSFSDAVTLTVTGTWTLLVDPSGTSTGSVTVKLYTFTDVAGGTIVANGAAKSLTTTRPGQNGSFSFSGTNGQKISFEVTASTIGGYVELHKPDGSYAGTYTNANVGSFSDAATLTVTGTWTLLVDPGGTSTGSITVKLYTFTDVTGTITPGGAAKAVTITTPGQNGSLTFSGTSGNVRSFQVTTSSISGGYVELHRPDGSYAGTYSCLTAGCTAGPATLDASGTWSLFVDPGGTATGTANIKLT
jgi:hypothetical protein